MIVRFDLEYEIVLVVEADDSGIVLEHTYAPIVLAILPPGSANLLSSSKDCLFEHVFELARLRLPRSALVRAHRSGIGDSPAERFMAAVLAPGLSKRFQLSIGGVAAKLEEVRLDRLHFRERQE